MKTRLFVFVIAFYAITDSAAQETQSFDHDFGFNTNFIFQGLFQSQQAPFSIMYKKYSAENKAMRLGVDLSFFSNNNDVQGSANTSFTNSYNGDINLTVGFERQSVLGGRWMWYYGVDAVPVIAFSKSEAYSDSDTKTTTNSFSSLGLGVKPLIGIRFNINQRLYVSAEASAQLTYSKSWNRQVNHTSTTIRDATSDNINFDVNPASGVFIFYRF